MPWNHIYCIVNGEVNTNESSRRGSKHSLVFLVKFFQGKFLSTVCECYCFLFCFIKNLCLHFYIVKV
jgi:hypothetical protein